MSTNERFPVDHFAVTTGGVLAVAGADYKLSSHVAAASIALTGAAVLTLSGRAEPGMYGRDLRNGLVIGAAMATAKFLGL